MTTSKNIIIGKFENNDIPSAEDFQEVFDSYLHKDFDRASFQMVQAGIDREHYVTPELLRTGLQNLGIITGNCYMPYKENLESSLAQIATLNLTYPPIVDSVRVYKNGQLLTEDKDGEFDKDYVVDYNTGIIRFSSPVIDRNIEVDYWYKNFGPVSGGTDITNLSNKYVDLTTNQTVGGNKTFTGTTTLTAPAIQGREALVKGQATDNSVDMFQIANGTTTSGRFIPTFIGYTEGGYESLLFRGLGKADDDVSNASPYVRFLAARTDDSTDPNNGTLLNPSNRDLFSWGSVTDYMRMKADGRLILGYETGGSTAKLQVSGNIKSTGFVKDGGTSNQYLMADGSVSSSVSSDYDAGSSGLGPYSVAGYQKFSNGLILQWSILTSGTTTYSFPLAWPNGASSVVVSTVRTSSGSRGTNHVANISKTNYYAVIDGNTGYMFAIGR